MPNKGSRSLSQLCGIVAFYRKTFLAQFFQIVVNTLFSLLMHTKNTREQKPTAVYPNSSKKETKTNFVLQFHAFLLVYYIKKLLKAATAWQNVLRQ